MGLPGHRRTSSDKRRRASHFALKAAMIIVDKKTGTTHRPHCAAPNATEYNGHPIHRKGSKRKLEKLLKKSSKPEAEPSHEGHNHS